MISFNGLSDLASNGANKRQLTGLRTDLELVGQRLSTGKYSAATISRRAGTAELSGIERELGLMKTREQAAVSGQLELDAKQQSLGIIRDTTSKLGLEMKAALGGGSASTIMTVARGARDDLGTLVTALNRSVGGKSLFSGAALDTAAVADPDQILNDVVAVISGASDEASAIAAVDYYFFDPAGGFEATAYLGSGVSAPDLIVAPNTLVSNDIRADNTVIREALRNVSIVAAVATGALPGALSENVLLDEASSNQLLTTGKLIGLEQELGQKQEFINRITVQEGARRNILEFRRAEIVNSDTFEDAAIFEEITSQIEINYKIISKLSYLRLANYLE